METVIIHPKVSVVTLAEARQPSICDSDLMHSRASGRRRRLWPSRSSPATSVSPFGNSPAATSPTTSSYGGVFLRAGLAERDDVNHMVAVARALNPDRPGARLGHRPAMV